MASSCGVIESPDKPQFKSSERKFEMATIKKLPLPRGGDGVQAPALIKSSNRNIRDAIRTSVYLIETGPQSPFASSFFHFSTKDALLPFIT
jgi:hypothetical protein